MQDREAATGAEHGRITAELRPQEGELQLLGGNTEGVVSLQEEEDETCTCYYCNKPGHWKQDCPQYKQDHRSGVLADYRASVNKIRNSLKLKDSNSVEEVGEAEPAVPGSSMAKMMINVTNRAINSIIF